ncbi:MULTISPECIES: hypothetical protein [unclassified Microcoleus]|nr:MULTISPECIES: hypothetical protein [unclassified Microcoleus]
MNNSDGNGIDMTQSSINRDRTWHDCSFDKTLQKLDKNVFQQLTVDS